MASNPIPIPGGVSIVPAQDTPKVAAKPSAKVVAPKQAKQARPAKAAKPAKEPQAAKEPQPAKGPKPAKEPRPAKTAKAAR